MAAVLFAHSRYFFARTRALSFPGANKSAPRWVLRFGPERMKAGPLLTGEVSVMQTKLAAVALTALTVLLPWASALADGPRASSYHAIGRPAEQQARGVPAAPHYEWQYHYAGHHPRFEGHWALVQ
jgi:hypothetical protein